MKYLLLFTFFGSIMCGQILAQQDTVLLQEAAVLDSVIFRKALGQKIVDVSEHPAKKEFGTLSDLAFHSPLNISGNGADLISNPIIRGTHANGTQVFWNGLPVNSPTLGTSDLNLLPTGLIDEIQILSGGAVELGSGAVGGSLFLNNVLQFSKEPAYELDLSATNGSFGRFGLGAKYRQTSSRNSLSAGIMVQQSNNNFQTKTPWGEDYQMPNAGISRESANIAWQHRFNKALIQSFVLAQHILRELPDASSAYNPHNPSEAYEDDIAVRWQNRFITEGWVIEQGFNVEKQRYQDLRWAIDDTNNFLLSATEVQKNIIRRKNLKWNAAGWFNYHKAEGSNVNKEQLEYGLRTSLIYAFSTKFTTKAAISMNFLDDHHIFYTAKLDPQGNESGFALPFLPSLGAEYQLFSYLGLRAKVGMVYNMPTLNERYWPGLGNVDILPETGFSSEIGYDVDVKRDKISLTHSATFYYLLLNNKVAWLPWQGRLSPLNIDKTRSTGAELSAGITYKPQTELKIELLTQFNITRSIVMQSHRPENAVEGKQLIYIPEYTGGGTLSIGFKQLSYYLSASYNSGAYPTSDNDEFSKLAAFVLLNSGIQFEFRFRNFNLSPRLDVYNITDTDYELYAFRPNPGINYQISLNSTIKL